MPGLQSFCVTTAMALGSIYLLQITWFAAWLSLDEKRIGAARNACLPCLLTNTDKKQTFGRRTLKEDFLKGYYKLVNSAVYRIIVIIIALVLAVIGIWGCIEIKQHFDFLLLLPEDSYLRRWNLSKKELYPDRGWKAEIYTQELNYSSLASFENLTKELEQLTKDGFFIKSKEKTYFNLRRYNFILSGFDDWWTELKLYSSVKKNISRWQDFANPKDFPKLMSDFLFSSYGSKIQENFKFDEDLMCNQVIPRIKVNS